MIKQLSKSDWKENAASRYLCTLNFYPQDLSVNFGINFFEYEEFGLGKQLGALIDISGTIYWLFSAADESGTIGLIRNDPDSGNINREALKVTVKIKSIEEDPNIALEKLCHELGLSRSDLYWIHE
jgi:hypothetical protein